jgi:hypothetical protein
MKKILIICILFVSSCGYQPIYLNKNLKNYEFQKIIVKGEKNINRQIINFLGLKENTLDNNLNELLLKTDFNIEETSKDSKGKIKSFRSKITIDLTISNNKNIIESKKFLEEFSYNNKNNKFELLQYQKEIKDNLVNRVLEEIVFFLNL